MMNMLVFLGVLTLSLLSPALMAAQNGTVVTPNTAIRTEPKADAAIIESKAPGSVIRMSSETKDGWFKTRTSNGQLGWVHQEDVRPEGYNASYDSANLDRKHRDPHDRRERESPRWYFRSAIGPNTFIAPDVNWGFGRRLLDYYVAPAFMMQAAYRITEDLRLALRFEYSTTSGDVTPAPDLNNGGRTPLYTVEFSSLPLYLGAEYEFLDTRQWSLYLGIYAGVGLADSIHISSSFYDPPNATTIQGTPLMGILEIGTKYNLTTRWALTGEMGLRYARTFSGSTIDRFNGDAPYFRGANGELLKLHLEEHGLFMFFGAELRF